MRVRTAEGRLCSFKQRPGVDIQPRRSFEDGLRTNRPQAGAFVVFGRRRKQLPQPPDREFMARRPLSASSSGQNRSISRSRRCGRSGKVKRKPANRRPAGPRSDQICSLLRVTLLAPSKLTVNTDAPPAQTQLKMPLLDFGHSSLEFQLQFKIAVSSKNCSLSKKSRETKASVQSKNPAGRRRLQEDRPRKDRSQYGNENPLFYRGRTLRTAHPRTSRQDCGLEPRGCSR